MRVTIFAFLLVAPFVFVTLAFAAELLVGIRPMRRPRLRDSASATAVIVVPAHNEEALIGNSLGALKHAAGQHARILVVADNCTDGTAAIARALGVQVAERTDPSRRGKGFALAYAQDALKDNRPDVVIVMDADCWTDQESIRSLIAACAASGRPCQATNLQAPPAVPAPPVQLSNFAFFIKNVVRQRGLQRLAGRAHLLGTGMALPWLIFAQCKLATDNVVEDMQIGVELAEAGYAPLFVEEACVWSNSEIASKTLMQRRRWEGGFLRNAAAFAPAMLLRSLAAADIRGLWAAINIIIPPIALLVLLDFTALLIAAFLARFGGARAWPAMLLAAALLVACFGLASAWVFGGRRFVTLGALLRIPMYILWKLPMYVSFARRGAPKDWIRTR